MTSLIFMIVLYFVILTLFACYSYIQAKEARKFIDWCDKSETEVSAIRERNLELEKRVKELEAITMPHIVPEPDFKVKKGGSNE